VRRVSDPAAALVQLPGGVQQGETTEDLNAKAKALHSMNLLVAD
jgi:hypothetical protein